MRPTKGLSAEQTRDYNALAAAYTEVFRVVGRAKACGVPNAQQQLERLMDEMKRRHGEHGDIWYTVMFGFTAGNENRVITDEEVKKPRPPVPCDIIVGQMQNLRLPPIPASLVLRDGQPLDRVKSEWTASSGPYRFVTRTPAAGGPDENLVIHRDRIVFKSLEAFGNDRLVEGRTPVLLVATLSNARRCRDGKPYMTWHAVSLPAAGAPAVSNLEADCMVVWESKGGLCAWQNSDNDRRRSRLYRIDDEGHVTFTGERPVGACPN
jgi:hypothetical protein